ncbi:hypothetical protein ACELLULO517_22615 [Acidisoma cellulosilytica]|uniref:Lipoprotein n=1 Tax=Acidisoma cellulosilyticum TaxID=2802395 RepID=A0A963Z5P5_9PROT|nr:hypothetical protein [Acidisoma cellulosilyticum]MCB8883059.1 hypothetical protein [Acidisoma cellulosilyticum]
MRARLLMLAGALICIGGSAACAQPVNLQGSVQATPLPPPRVGTSLPMMPAITASNYATAVPPLEAAETAVAGRRYRQAAEDLEAAETRLLNAGAQPIRSTVTPGGQALAQVRLARDAVRRRDRQTGLTAISMAIGAAQESIQQPAPPVVAEAHPAPLSVVVATAVPPAPLPVPMVTKALLPGHWQEGSWEYHWEPPETALRPVETRSVEQGQFVFKSGIGWVWVPSHYVN